MTKNDIRALMRSREKEFSGGQSESAEIWAKVESLPVFGEARTVLVYMAIPGEVPTSGFIEKWRGSKRIAIPLVEGDNLILCEYDPAHLKAGYKGIPEPDETAERISPEEIDLALVPGVAFAIKDGKMWRMGRGKGFYDRLLPRLRCPKAGIFFSYRLVDSLPLDPWDQPLDIL